MSIFSDDFGQFLRDWRAKRANRKRMHPAKVRRNWVGVATTLFMLVSYAIIGILAFSFSGWWFLLSIPVIGVAVLGGRIMDWYDWKYDL